jgi:LPS export ABC transporter protein LptC
MQEPSGNMTLNDGTILNLVADEGVFDQDKNTIALRNAVDITSNSNYRLQTDALDVDFITNSAQSDEDVRATGPDGIITARGLRVSDNGGKIQFIGPAKFISTAKSHTHHSSGSLINLIP